MVAAEKTESRSRDSVLAATLVVAIEAAIAAAVAAEEGGVEAGHLIKENLRYFVAKRV